MNEVNPTRQKTGLVFGISLLAGVVLTYYFGPMISSLLCKSFGFDLPNAENYAPAGFLMMMMAVRFTAPLLIGLVAGFFDKEILWKSALMFGGALGVWQLYQNFKQYAGQAFHSGSLLTIGAIVLLSSAGFFLGQLPGRRCYKSRDTAIEC